MDSIASLDVETSSSQSSSASFDYGFAFDDSNFSDRILRIEIMDGGAVSDSIDISVRPEEQIVRCSQPDDDHGLNGDSDDEERVAVIEEEEEEPSGAEALNRNDSNWSVECSTAVRVKTIHISSPILAAKSPFFYKMFSNGMRESEQRHATLCIDASEEAALMELLNFMYSNTLSITTAPAILDVLMAADKFEVASCMRYCSCLLRKLPMTPESALLYLDLPSSILMGEAVLPLTEAAKQFLVTRYKDMTKYQQEVMELPLAGIEAVLSSDDLQVASEDAVYDFTVKWARANYPKLEERREIFGTHLIRYIRFPLMSSRKLKKLLTSNDLATVESVSNTRRFIERAYKYRPVKVMEFDVPRQQCIVYLDLTREECLNLFPSGRVYSQAFHLNGQGFFLSAHCNMDHQCSFHCFGLFLGMQDKGSVTFPVDYEFAARTSPSDEFTSKFKGNYTFTGGKAVGFRNMFSTPWSSFIAEDSPFFINGILHLRADISVKV